ncbi:MAG: Asp23/Gls24 family envelope stress response protein [Propionibacteriaceae bacterium]
MSTRLEPRHRGRLVLTAQVVEKIASQAASEMTQAGSWRDGVLGLGRDAASKARPRAKVDLSVDSADLELWVGVAYPGSIRAATRRVREHVIARVEDLTGIDVRRVDIDVTFLTSQLDDTSAALR